jgi:predicted HTH transcriptional regulator
MELDEFLVKMRILDRETQQCTFAGLLFFGQREAVEKYFADFRIDVLEIPGTSYTDASSRYTFRLTEDDYENLWEAYFECMKRLRKEVDVEFKLNPEGFGEELSPGLLAVREALVNMLMHADYFAPACPRVRIFNNHIEYYNPGGLPKPLKELKGNDLSIPRNPILAKLFRMVKLAENAGYGFDKIDYNWKVYNNSTPEYIIDLDAVIVKLLTQENVQKEVESLETLVDFGSLAERLAVSSDENLAFLRDNYAVITGDLRDKYGINDELMDINKNDKNIFILFIMQLFPRITALELASILGTSERTIRRLIQKLIEKRLLTREGSDKTGTWRIEKSDSGKFI